MTPHTKDLIFGKNYEGKNAFDQDSIYYLDLKDLNKDELPEVAYDIASILKANQYMHPGFFFKFISDEMLDDILESFKMSALIEGELPKYGITHEEQKHHRKALNAITALLMTSEGFGMYTLKEKALAVEMLHLLSNVERSHRSGLCKARHENFSVVEMHKVLFDPVEPV